MRWCSIASLLLAVSATTSCAPPLTQSYAQGTRDVGGERRVDEPPDPGPIPVTAADPQRGDRDALVTIVEFADFQCPFCRRAARTIEQLRQKYGPAELRVVWKHSPLPAELHPLARRAHELAFAAFESRGDKGFWTFHDAVFLNERPFTEDLYRDAGIAAGLKGDDAVDHRVHATVKIDADLALGEARGVSGTPAFFVNGVHVSGAQSLATFVEIVDDEIANAKRLVAAGLPRGHVYAVRTAENVKHAPKPPAPEVKAPAPPDTTVWRVPIGKSPVRGSARALVTIVEFGDYQCPYCARVQPTLDRIVKEYGDKVRIVFKDNPLPFHKHAGPAAAVAREVRQRRGDAAFWKFAATLFDGHAALEDDDLVRYAAAAQVPEAAARAAMASTKIGKDIEEDADLAEDVGASGTPSFFINGLKFTGAQPFERFQAVIDAELAKAQAIVKAGTPANKVYDAIQAKAKPFELPPRVAMPAPTAANPSRGPANAKIVIHYFSDFQCPFCRRVEPTLAQLEKEFPGQIRVVWRNYPLSFHAGAEPAAQAAMEAYAQKGAKGFWAMHDELFGEQANLDRAGLDAAARKLGLDMTRFAAALDGHTHKAEIDADMAAARIADVTGTPGFVVAGYFVNGAQPIQAFRRIVKHALENP